MKVQWKRILSAMLAIVMITGMLTVPASAAEEVTPVKVWDLKDGNWPDEQYAEYKVDRNDSFTFDGLEVNATQGKWGGSRLGTGQWPQVTQGTIIKVPVDSSEIAQGKKAVVTILSYYSDSFTVDGTPNEKDQNTKESFTCDGTSGSVTIEGTNANGYLAYISLGYTAASTGDPDTPSVTELQDGTIDFMGSNGENTFKTTPYIAWVSGTPSFNSSHGVLSSGCSFTVKVPADKKANITINSCMYNNGPTLSVGDSPVDPSVGEMNVTDFVYPVTDLTGTVTFTCGGTFYIHSIDVELVDPNAGQTFVAPDTYYFSTKGHQGVKDGAVGTISAMDGVSGVKFSGFSAHEHGPHGTGTMTVSLPEDQYSTLVVTTCGFGGHTGATSSSGDLQSKAAENSDGGKEYTIYNATGATTITFAGETYVHGLTVGEFVDAPVTVPPTLTLDKELVMLKLGETTSDTVTATVANSDGAVKAQSNDTSVADASVEGNVITITAEGEGDTTVDVTVAGTDLSKSITVHVDPSGDVVSFINEGTYTFNASDFSQDKLTLIKGLSVSGLAYNTNGHGLEGSNASMTVNLSGKANLTVITCRYNAGTALDMTSSSGTVTSSKVNENGANGLRFVVIGAEGETTLTFTPTAEASSSTINVHSLMVEYTAAPSQPGDRKIDVWDLGGKVETGEDYVNHITPADWASKNVVSASKFASGGEVTFGDLTVNYASGDRLYSNVSDPAFDEILDAGENKNNSFAKTFADGYVSEGVYYANGSGGDGRRYVALAHVAAGDKIVAYIGSHGNGDVVFYFEGQGAASSQKESVTAKQDEYVKFDFVAQYDGTYKIWADASSGKPRYHRIVRVPGVAVSGAITLPGEFDADDYSVKFINRTTNQETLATLGDNNTYTVTLAPGFSYIASLSGAPGWGFSEGTRLVTTTDADALMGMENVNLTVVTKPLYTYSGTITGMDDLTGLVITMIPDEASAATGVENVKLTITAADKTFTAQLEPNVEYTIQLTGANDYAVVSPAVVTSTGGNLTGQVIALERKNTHTASGKFIDLEGKASAANVTSLSFKNVDDGYTYEATVANGGYTVELRDGAYESVVGVSGYSTITHVVVDGADVTKDLLFVSTAAKPAVTWVKDVYVGYPDKANNYATVNAAVDAISRMGVNSEDKRVTVHIAPGTYREQVIIKTPYITFINDEPEKEVLLTWYYGIGYVYYSSGTSDGGYYNAQRAYDKYEKKIADRWGVAVRVLSNGFRAENITFENSFNRYVTDEELADGVEVSYTENIRFPRAKGADVQSKTATERASAIAVEANECEFYNCKFYSSQDTLYTQGNAYFKNCFIEGQTDYIFGSGNVVFDACTLSWKGYSEGSQGGYITASRPNDTPGCIGYLFRDCTVVGNPDLTVTTGYWGRTWGANAMVTLLNTKLEKDGLIAAAGWYNMNGDPKNANYHEYGTTLNGAAADVSGRVEGTVMTEAEANAVDIADYFGSWDPYYYDYDPSTGGGNEGTGGNGGSSSMVPTTQGAVSAGGSSTVTNPDGSKTTTKTDRNGTTTVTTVAIDGSKTESVTTKDGDKTITATDPKGEVVAKVELPATIPAPEEKFTDVPEGHWAEQAINDMAGLGIINGISESVHFFDMTSAMTRGSIATILYRFSNGAEGKTTTFDDVATGEWYADAIGWASEVGIVTGYSDSIFAPKDVISREQLAVMIFRFAKLIGMDTNVGNNVLDGFVDADATGTWATDAMTWCTGKGIITGKPGNVLDPAADVSRAEASVMFSRLIALI